MLWWGCDEEGAMVWRTTGCSVAQKGFVRTKTGLVSARWEASPIPSSKSSAHRHSQTQITLPPAAHGYSGSVGVMSQVFQDLKSRVLPNSWSLRQLARKGGELSRPMLPELISNLTLCSYWVWNEIRYTSLNHASTYFLFSLCSWQHLTNELSAFGENGVYWWSTRTTKKISRRLRIKSWTVNTG